MKSDIPVSINTDFFASLQPKQALAKIARVYNLMGVEQRFIQFCFHWNDDFIYGFFERSYILQLLKKHRLLVLQLHGSSGKEKSWTSTIEYRRKAGVELVKNRIFLLDSMRELACKIDPELVSRYNCNVLTMHIKREPIRRKKESLANFRKRKDSYWQAVIKSFQELSYYCRYYGIKIALENFTYESFSTTLMKLIKCPDFSDFVSFCFDTGHANIGADGLKLLDHLSDDLVALHVHDNNKKKDQHGLPFTGNFDFNRFIRLLRAIPYNNPINLEVCVSPRENILDFLRKAVIASRIIYKRVHIV